MSSLRSAKLPFGSTAVLFAFFFVFMLYTEIPLETLEMILL